MRRGGAVSRPIIIGTLLASVGLMACTSLLGGLPGGTLEDSGTVDATSGADGSSSSSSGSSSSSSSSSSSGSSSGSGTDSAISVETGQDSAISGDTGSDTGPADTGGGDTDMTDSGWEAGCKRGDIRCAGTTAETCDSSGMWTVTGACKFGCLNGMCTACTPGISQQCGDPTTCNAGGMQQCDNTGSWGPCSLQAEPCVALPAGGWTPYAIPGAGGCPGGFANPVTYISAASGSPDSCSCTCSGTQSCTATAQLGQYTDPTCTLGGTVLGIPTIGPTCSSPPIGAVAAADYYTVSNPQPAVTPACVAAPAVSSAPPISQASQFVCTAQLTCPAGACLTSAQQGSLCVGLAGNNACPTGFPNKTLLANGISDTRGCGPCACGSNLACTLSSVLLDNDSTCGGAGPYDLTVSPSSCASTTSSFPINGIKGTFTATGSGACATVTTASSPTGGVGLDPTTTMTVCCP